VTGVDIIRAVQSIHSPLLDSLFLKITDLHSENIYLVVLPLLFWLYDKRLARYLTSVFILSFWANDVIKDLFHTARPSPNDVRVVRPEPSYAFPSGHSMTPLMFWGGLAMHFKQAWLTVVIAVMVFLIGLSRLYIGVHWPLDVLGGWTIGALMLMGFAATYGFWTGEKQPLSRQMLIAVAIPTVAAVISVLMHEVPALTAARDENLRFYIIIGAYLGFLVGSALEEAYVGFNPRQGGLGAQIVKVVAGLALVLLVKEGFKLFLPHNNLGDLIRYFCVTMMATFGAPFVFQRFVARPPIGRGIPG
jgi:membrane-associated phospholipid phosphatase